PVEPVVGTHHHRRIGGADDLFEGRQVDLTQSAFIHFGAGPHPVGFLVVGGEVLHTRPHTLGLDPLHQCGGDPCGDVGVFGHVLEVASAQWGTLDVHAGAEHHVHTHGARLGSQGRTDPAHQVGVPGRAEGDGG